MLRRVLIMAMGLGLAAPAFAKPAARAEVTCKDGSLSVAGRGACSHHGGVAAATPARAPAAPPRTTLPPPLPGVTATARCKDGSLSYAKHHTGACSHHGGVVQWL